MGRYCISRSTVALVASPSGSARSNYGVGDAQGVGGALVGDGPGSEGALWPYGQLVWEVSLYVCDKGREAGASRGWVGECGGGVAVSSQRS